MNYGSLKSAEIILSKSIFYVKNYLMGIKQGPIRSLDKASKLMVKLENCPKSIDLLRLQKVDPILDMKQILHISYPYVLYILWIDYVPRGLHMSSFESLQSL